MANVQLNELSAVYDTAGNVINAIKSIDSGNKPTYYYIKPASYSNLGNISAIADNDVNYKVTLDYSNENRFVVYRNKNYIHEFLYFKYNTVTSTWSCKTAVKSDNTIGRYMTYDVDWDNETICCFIWGNDFEHYKGQAYANTTFVSLTSETYLKSAKSYKINLTSDELSFESVDILTGKYILDATVDYNTNSTIVMEATTTGVIKIDVYKPTLTGYTHTDNFFNLNNTRTNTLASARQSVWTAMNVESDYAPQIESYFNGFDYSMTLYGAEIDNYNKYLYFAESDYAIDGSITYFKDRAVFHQFLYYRPATQWTGKYAVLEGDCLFRYLVGNTADMRCYTGNSNYFPLIPERAINAFNCVNEAHIDDLSRVTGRKFVAIGSSFFNSLSWYKSLRSYNNSYSTRYISRVFVNETQFGSLDIVTKGVNTTETEIYSALHYISSPCSQLIQTSHGVFIITNTGDLHFVNI